MEKLIQKQKFVFQALDTLDLAINIYQESLQSANDPLWRGKAFASEQQMERSLRDSMIQRFEFSSDLFWKFLKEYLEKSKKLILKARDLMEYSVLHVNLEL